MAVKNVLAPARVAYDAAIKAFFESNGMSGPTCNEIALSAYQLDKVPERWRLWFPLSLQSLEDFARHKYADRLTSIQYKLPTRGAQAAVLAAIYIEEEEVIETKDEKALHTPDLSIAGNRYTLTWGPVQAEYLGAGSRTLFGRIDTYVRKVGGLDGLVCVRTEILEEEVESPRDIKDRLVHAIRDYCHSISHVQKSLTPEAVNELVGEEELWRKIKASSDLADISDIHFQRLAIMARFSRFEGEGLAPGECGPDMGQMAGVIRNLRYFWSTPLPEGWSIKVPFYCGQGHQLSWNRTQRAFFDEVLELVSSSCTLSEVRAVLDKSSSPAFWAPTKEG